MRACDENLVRTDFQAWNENLMPDRPILPDSARVLGPFLGGLWNLKAAFADGSVIYDCDVALDTTYQRRIQLPTDGRADACRLGDPSKGSILIYNRDTRPLTGIWMLPAWAAGPWPRESLPTPVATGHFASFTGVSPDSYDLKATFQDGTTVYRCDVPITAGQEAVVNAPDDFRSSVDCLAVSGH